MQAHHQQHRGPAEQVQPGHLTAHVLAPDEAVVAAPDGHGDDHQQNRNPTNGMPEHGVDGGLAKDAANAWQWHRQQHFVEAGGHREEGDAFAGHQVVQPIVKTAAGHGQGEAEESFLQGVERAGEVEGDSDREQADGEMHQVGVQGDFVGKVVSAERVGDVVDRRCNRGKQGHDSAFTDCFHHGHGMKPVNPDELVSQIHLGEDQTRRDEVDGQKTFRQNRWVFRRAT